jgi:uncharacterized membrane protein YhiD involved in acid resistance
LVAGLGLWWRAVFESVAVVIVMSWLPWFEKDKKKKRENKATKELLILASLFLINLD